MRKDQTLLSILSDGEWHSGEALAQSLGVSRTAVWKQLNRLMGPGVVIERIRGKGYRLLSHLDLLDHDRIMALFGDSARSRASLEVLDNVDSTNTRVMQRGKRGGDEVFICVADRQTQGRGRRGRVWSSPAGENIYLSMGVRLQGGFSALEGLSLVVGIGVCRALESLGLKGAGLKWPNDVLFDGCKLAGILIELQGELEGAVRVIVGVGINVHMNRVDAAVDQPWVSLDAAAPSVPWKRNEVIAAVVNQALDALAQFEREGFAAFQDDWRIRDSLLGVSLRTEPEDVQGIGAGVDSTGAYLLETASGQVTVRAGELSLRRNK
ncbi:biotin--[acetyl-CoA-carboxylase] ligase [Marinobacter sp. 1Y8]